MTLDIRNYLKCFKKMINYSMFVTFLRQQIEYITHPGGLISKLANGTCNSKFGASYRKFGVPCLKFKTLYLKYKAHYLKFAVENSGHLDYYFRDLI